MGKVMSTKLILSLLLRTLYLRPHLPVERGIRDFQACYTADGNVQDGKEDETDEEGHEDSCAQLATATYRAREGAGSTYLV